MSAATKCEVRHVLTIPGWHPTRLNQLLTGVRQRIRLKKADRQMIGTYARLAGIPKAQGRRRVSLVLTLGPRQRGADPDGYWKLTLDALVQAGLLVDDSRHWCELGTVTFVRGPARQTAIVLEDLANSHGNGQPKRRRRA